MSTSERPTVSILIPCFNAEGWVARALDSALAQTLPAEEILVMDDGSEDGSRDVLDGFADRVTVVHAPHRGSAPTRNALRELARGDWLQMLDADDTLQEDKLERQVELLRGGKYDLVAAPIVTDNGQVMHTPTGGDPWIDLMNLSLGITTSNLWRREAVERAGGWNVNITCCDDYDLSFRMLKTGARVLADKVPRSTWSTENPESMSHRDEAERDRQVAQIVRAAVRHLEDEESLTEDHRMTAARRLMHLAHVQWHRPHQAWRETVRYLEETHPRPWELKPRGRGIYTGLYRSFGFAWAQRYDDLACSIRRKPS